MSSDSSANLPGFDSPGSPLSVSLYSEKELGCILAGKKTTFRLFAPRAKLVQLVLYRKFDDEAGEELAMRKDPNGVWECVVPKNLAGALYGYRVDGPSDKGEMFNPAIVIGDPYSRAVVTRNNCRHPAKTLIIDDKYDWADDSFVIPANHNELVIYEAHVRDMTAHPSSGVSAKGTYAGLMELNRTGGLSYLKELGVNALELLPIHKFGTIELPYRDAKSTTEEGEYNTWNPYARNHWGYMTSYYFAPETYYGTDGSLEKNAYAGIDGRAVGELKDLVKALHKEGISVILDVVFNHTSQYDYNPYKYIDKFYYYLCEPSGKFVKKSGCGNDFNTARPMAQRMIVDCIRYWMKEYHIDGFRFDIATMIDRQTCRMISRAAQGINPNVMLIAEPWGGGKWDPPGFSDIGWAAWNDWIRNGVKGQHHSTDLGFIFGRYQGKNTKKSLVGYVTGTLREDGGMFLKKEHSVNYLESHDNYTLGDFIRLGLGDMDERGVVQDLESHARLTPKQLALNKLAALFLFTSQGPVMMHEGQEFARSKVIAKSTAPDPKAGTLDHNSYEKDNDTNYINYDQRDMNRELYDYYKGLIALRKKHPVFSSADKKSVEFLDTKDDLVLAYRFKPGGFGKESKQFLVILNGNINRPTGMRLPPPKWRIVADARAVASDDGLGEIEGEVSMPPSSGVILMQE